MQLSAPKQIVFLISLIAIIAGIVGYLADWPSELIAFWVTAGGALLLALGNLFKGI